MSHVTSAVVVLKTLSLVMGGLVTFFAAKAYRRTGSTALRMLAVGFGVVTLGALIAGAIDQMLSMRPAYALIVESATSTLGFAVILYSLYAD